MTIQFNWKYYAYGSNIGTLYVYWRTQSGVLNLLRSISGQQHSSSSGSYDSYSEDLSSYANSGPGRIVLKYKNPTYWRGDIQLDDMELIGTTDGDIDFDPSVTRYQVTGSSNPHWIKSSTYTYDSLPSLTGSTWTAVPNGTSPSNRWNYDYGGTPSSSTGGTRDAAGSTTGYYLYAEASSPNYSSSATRVLWAAMDKDYSLQPATPTTIGTVTISGPSTGESGSNYGPYTYTASISGDAANPQYTWYLSNSQAGSISVSGATAYVSWDQTGTYYVYCAVTDQASTDSPVTSSKSVTVTQGALLLGTPTITGSDSPVISTEQTYTITGITDAATLTDETYQWSIIESGGGSSGLQSSGTISINDIATAFGGSEPHSLDEYYRGGTLVPDNSSTINVPTSGVISLDDFYNAGGSASLSFSGQGTTSVTLTWPSSAGTYSVDCTVSSATASDSPKTASLQVSVVEFTNVITSPTLGSYVNGGWTSVGDGVGQVNIDRTAFVIGRVYDVTITTGPTAWHPSASNFRDSVRHGMGISDNHNNIANGPNQSRLKRIVLRGDVSSNYYYYFVSATDVSDYYGIELHAWVDGTSSTAGYIFRRFYDVTSLNTRNGSNPSITTYSGSQTFDSSSLELGTTINSTINRAAGGYATNYLGQPLNFTAATSGWVLLNAIFRKGTGDWTASGGYMYFKVIEIQSNGNADTEMVHSVIGAYSNSTSQYVASQWVHFDQGRNYRVYAYYSNRYDAAASTWGPHYIDIRSGNASTGPLWHTYTCQVNVT